MTKSILLWALGMKEVIIILVIVLLLFGGRKIPELMRGIRRGIDEFKDAKKNKEEEAKKSDTKPDVK